MKTSARSRARSNRALARHGAAGMWIAQFAARPTEAHERAWTEPPRRSVAALTTHDLPPWAAFWDGDDIDERVALGYLEDRAADADRAHRAGVRAAVTRTLGLAPDAGAATIHDALCEMLAGSRAAIALFALGDLFGEHEPVNVPGTTNEVPNWRRRASRPLAALADDGDIRAVLKTTAAMRSERR